MVLVMSQAKFKRKQFMIDHALQLKLTLEMALLPMTGALLAWGNIVIYDELIRLLNLFNIDNQGVSYNWLYVTLIVLVNFIIFISISIVLSHRIAGPLFHINRVLKTLKQGLWFQRVHLRQTDHLKDLADNINELSDELVQRLEHLQQVVSDAKTLAEQQKQAELLNKINAIETQLEYFKTQKPSN